MILVSDGASEYHANIFTSHRRGDFSGRFHAHEVRLRQKRHFGLPAAGVTAGLCASTPARTYRRRRRAAAIPLHWRTDFELHAASVSTIRAALPPLGLDDAIRSMIANTPTSDKPSTVRSYFCLINTSTESGQFCVMVGDDDVRMIL